MTGKGDREPMTYNFKLAQEIFWLALVTAAVTALTMLVKFDPSTIASWSDWAISIGAGVTRAVAAALIAKFATRG